MTARLDSAHAVLRAAPGPMVEDLAVLVACESPSDDPAALAAAADVLAELGAARLGVAPERLDRDGCSHLRWSFGGAPEVLLIGHFDTVWPLGTSAGWPFAVVDGQASGPGAFDMKAGLVQGLHALAALEDLDGVVLLVTGDEEIGSPTSRQLIEETVRGARAALVLEPSAPGGALKTARKGVSLYELAVSGRAAHAGLEPERGVNALIELAHQVLAVGAVARPDLGTTVTPTVAAAGSATNTVPASASARVDVRALSVAEQQRVDDELRGLVPMLEGAAIDVRGGPNRPPMHPESSQHLFERAVALAAELGLGRLDGVQVGGGSDGNFTAAAGVPTLDGLGAVGDGAHARHEHVDVAAMPQRAALLAALVDDLRGRRP